MTLNCVYVSEWEEGLVESPCVLNTADFSFEAEVSEEGEDFEHLLREYIEIEKNGVLYELDVEDESLTEDAKLKLAELLRDGEE